MENKKSFYRATLLIAICAFASRILGLLRSTLLGSIYGATESQGLIDCYYASFKLPDIIYNLVAFGLFSVVLIPYFSRIIKKADRERLNNSCSGFLNFFFLLLTVFIVIGLLFSRTFVEKFLVRGWDDRSNIELTIKMTRIMLLQPLFMALSGIFGSYLNAIQRFKAYSYAMLSYNVGIICGIIFLSPIMGIEGVAWGTVLAGFIHLSIQASGAFINGYRFKAVLPPFDNEVKELVLIATPRIIAISGEQFVTFFIINFSSYIFTGSLAIYNYAENFSMVPYGMIAVSLSTTAFPLFSRYFIEKNFNDMFRSLMDKLQSVLFLIIPISILMVLCRFEIIDILLHYGNFTPRDVELTANSLAIYMLGIPFFSLTIIVVKFYYAQKKSILPMLVALTMVAVTTASGYYFSQKIDVYGLSLGRTSGYIVQALLLVGSIYYINRKEKLFSYKPTKELFNILKIFVISLAAGGVGYLVITNLNIAPFQLLSELELPASLAKVANILSLKSPSLLKCLATGTVVALFYLGASFILNIPEARALVNRAVRRGRK